MIEHARSRSLHAGRHERASNGLVCRRSPRRAVAYIVDFAAVNGATVLFEQKAVIDGYALGSDIEVSRYVIDSGQPDGASLVGHGLERLIRTIRCSSEAAIVVEHVSRFAMDYAVALRIAASLAAEGIVVHEARGGPTIVERDLAVTLAADVAGILAETRPPIRSRVRTLRRLPVTDCITDA